MSYSDLLSEVDLIAFGEGNDFRGLIFFQVSYYKSDKIKDSPWIAHSSSLYRAPHSVNIYNHSCLSLKSSHLSYSFIT